MKHPLLLSAALLAGLSLPFAARVRAQATPDTRQEELRRKQAEVEKLQDELSRAQKELDRLKQENQQLRREKTEAQSTAATATAAAEALAPKPSRPLANVPPVGPSEVVESRDLALYFKADPAGAAERFAGKTFRVRGPIEAFSPKLFRRDYEVLLESPDRQVKAAFGFKYAPDFTAVITKNHGQHLVAKTAGGGERQLLAAGDVITIQARCDGFSDNRVEFSRCQVVSR
jgi:multidrug efflux pump subunit AcrA (membrane-fusion protein)